MLNNYDYQEQQYIYRSNAQMRNLQYHYDNMLPSDNEPECFKCDECKRWITETQCVDCYKCNGGC